MFIHKTTFEKYDSLGNNIYRNIRTGEEGFIDPHKAKRIFIDTAEWFSKEPKQGEVVDYKSDYDTSEMEAFFSTYTQTEERIPISGYETVIDVNGFVASHILVIKSQKLKSLHNAYYNRLKRLYDTVKPTSP